MVAASAPRRFRSDRRPDTSQNRSTAQHARSIVWVRYLLGALYPLGSFSVERHSAANEVELLMRIRSEIVEEHFSLTRQFSERGSRRLQILRTGDLVGVAREIFCIEIRGRFVEGSDIEKGGIMHGCQVVLG